MKFSIRLTSKISTRIFTGHQALGQMTNFLHQPAFRNARMFILVDRQTRKYCLPLLLEQVPVLNLATILETAGGEQSKTYESALALWQMLLQEVAGKQSVIINLGGGVVTDLGGYVAAGYQRGIRYLNVPTSLIGMADAAIGGKTAINLDQIKNQIGHFYMPEAVFLFPGFLETLPVEHIRSGLAEIFKSILLGDPGLWRKYKSGLITSVIARPWSDPVWQELILRAVRFKSTLVHRDPYEKNLRKALNFGHTIGHAFESTIFKTQREPLLHGDAVAAGIFCAAFLSQRKTGLPEKDFREICNFFATGFQPVPVTCEDTEAILASMRHDKKNNEGHFRFTLIASPGSFRINQNCTASEVEQALNFYIDTLNAGHEIVSDK